MITVIESMPAGTLGFEATGKVEPEDYATVLVPAVHAAAARGPLRLLYVLGPDFDSYSAGALWADAELGVGHLTGWQRVAVATDHEWIEHAVRAFAWLMPGRIRVFGADEVDAAKAWLVADDD